MKKELWIAWQPSYTSTPAGVFTSASKAKEAYAEMDKFDDFEILKWKKTTDGWEDDNGRKIEKFAVDVLN